MTSEKKHAILLGDKRATRAEIIKKEGCAQSARGCKKGDTIMAEEKVIAEVKAEEVKKEVVKPVAKKAVAKKPVAKKEEKPVAEKKAVAKKAEKPAAEKKAPAKKAEKPVAEKKAVAKKAEKPAAEKKAPAKKAEKKVAAKATVFVQFAGKSFSQDELVKIAKDVWQYDMNMKADDFKTVEIYVKPEENTAYFVVNGEFPGSFVL